jgi:hypothetical protein
MDKVEIVEFVNFILLIYCCAKIYYSEKMSNCESKISQAGFIKRRNAKQINIQQSTINRFKIKSWLETLPQMHV